jgi:hypothetical protein
VQTDGTIRNSKPGIVIRDNGKGPRMLIDVGISEDGNVMRKEAENFLKYRRPCGRNSTHVECESKSDAGDNWCDLNLMKIIQMIREEYAGKLRNEGNTEKKRSRILHSTLTVDSTGVKVQNTQHGK